VEGRLEVGKKHLFKTAVRVIKFFCVLWNSHTVLKNMRYN